MNIYITVFTVAVVLTLIGYFWLANVGFKRSVLWGVLILLLSPITAICATSSCMFLAPAPETT